MDRATQPAMGLSPELVSLAAELHPKSGAGKFGLSCEQLANVLAEIAQKYGTHPAQVRELCFSLKI